MLLSVLSVLIGAAVGSFVNVLAARTVAGQSIFLPRSFCDACAKPLWRRDMIPVLSFFFLRARCRFCHIKLSWQYPLVEFCVAMLFLAAYLLHQEFDWLLVARWISIGALVALFLTDLRAMVLPDEITVPSIVILLAINFIFLHVGASALFIALLLGGGFFAVQYIVSAGRWMGSGDIRFGLLIAAITMYWQHTALAIMISYVVGSLVALPLLLKKKMKPTSQIPLGTFLAIGTLIELLFGNMLVRFLNFAW